MDNKNFLNKVSTAGVIIFIGILVSFSGVLSDSFADDSEIEEVEEADRPEEIEEIEEAEIPEEAEEEVEEEVETSTYGYGTTSSHTSGSISSSNPSVFSVENDPNVTIDDNSDLSKTTNNSANEEEEKEEKEVESDNPIKDVLEKEMSPEQEEQIKKILDIDDKELENLVDLAKNENSEEKEDTKEEIHSYFKRKIEKKSGNNELTDSKIQEKVNMENDSSIGNIDNNKYNVGNISETNSDINIYPNKLPQTGASL